MPHQLLRQTASIVARKLMTSRRKGEAKTRERLLESLVAVMPTSLEESELIPAILEGALAISLADNDFNKDEWELYANAIVRLKLTDQQLQSISVQGSLDLNPIAKRLAALKNSDYRLKIAHCFPLFAAADGAWEVKELGTLKTLLNALGYPELEQELPALCLRFQHKETWCQRRCCDLGEWLADWATPHAVFRTSKYKIKRR